MVEIILTGLFVLAVLGGIQIYRSDRAGWNATFKRLSRMVRASIESSKPVKQLEPVAKKAELDTWTAEFEGKELETANKHVIVRTWYHKIGGEIRPYWKCKCGVSDWHVNVNRANQKSKEHVKEQNAAEKLMARNGGTHAW